MQRRANIFGVGVSWREQKACEQVEAKRDHDITGCTGWIGGVKTGEVQLQTGDNIRHLKYQIREKKIQSLEMWYTRLDVTLKPLKSMLLSWRCQMLAWGAVPQAYGKLCCNSVATEWTIWDRHAAWTEMLCRTVSQSVFCFPNMKGVTSWTPNTNATSP